MAKNLGIQTCLLIGGNIVNMNMMKESQILIGTPGKM